MKSLNKLFIICSLLAATSSLFVTNSRAIGFGVDTGNLGLGGGLPSGLLPVDVDTSGDLTNFWDNLSGEGLDGICENVNIAFAQSAKLYDTTSANKIRYGLVINGSSKRSVRPYAEQRLALIDEAKIKLVGTAKKSVMNVELPATDGILPKVLPIGVTLSAGLEGNSIVMRPLEATSNYCSGLLELLKIYQFKTVFPLDIDRIKEMREGEIWKLPLYARFSFTINPSLPVAKVMYVTFSAGINGERKAMLSVRRIKNTVRVRLRIDHVFMETAGVSLNNVSILASDLGLDNGTNFFTQGVEKIVASQINAYLAASLGLNASHSGGQKLLLEYTIDLAKDDQVAALVDFLGGNFTMIPRLVAMGLNFSSFSTSATAAEGSKGLNTLSKSVNSLIELNRTYAGSDHYSGNSIGGSLRVPVAGAVSENWSNTYHRYQSLAGKDAAYHVQQANRTHSRDLGILPTLGQLTVRDTYQKDLFAANRERTNGKVTDPLLFYQQQIGLGRRGVEDARDALYQVKNIVKYAGMRGDGVNDYDKFDATIFFPPTPSSGSASSNGISNPQFMKDKVYKSVAVSFRMAFSEKAVQDIITAPAQAVFNAYMNLITRDTETAEIAKKAKDLYKVGEDGYVSYDFAAMQKKLGYARVAVSGGYVKPFSIAQDIARAATKFIQQLMTVRETNDPKKQSEILTQVGSSGDLRFEDFLKVVVQLVNVGDISAIVTLKTNKQILGEADFNQSYQMFNNNKGNGFDEKVNEIIDYRNHFSNPSVLSD